MSGTPFSDRLSAIAVNYVKAVRAERELQEASGPYYESLYAPNELTEKRDALWQELCELVDSAPEQEPELKKFSLVIPDIPGAQAGARLATSEVYGGWVQDFFGSFDLATELAARTSPKCLVCEYKLGYKGTGHVGIFTLARKC